MEDIDNEETLKYLHILYQAVAFEQENKNKKI